MIINTFFSFVAHIANGIGLQNYELFSDSANLSTTFCVFLDEKGFIHHKCPIFHIPLCH